MRKKKEKGEYNDEEEKYKLSGWNSDDDLGFSPNILKILQKKITFPSLQQKEAKPKKCPQNDFLPTVQEKTEFTSVCMA